MFLKMRLQLRQYITSEDSLLKEVNAHDIVDQIVMPPRFSWWWFNRMTESSEEQPVVTMSNRSGRIGKLPVTYVTYSSAQAPWEAEV
ncbi:hypothetical protein FRC12_013972 [Ceratobasidium sp. 428]|nr:hypothetical protein FRC12_013972 [Ceratobasidium sp. 428]